jgi:putative transposase
LVKYGTKTSLAKAFGISQSTLYYVSKKDKEDWKLKAKIEELLRSHPSYGSRRIAIELVMNRKRIQRVMRRFDIRPYRRRCRKKRRKQGVITHYANLLFTTIPTYPHHIWAADFTELWWRGRWIYVATAIDLYTREIVGIHVSLKKGVQLVIPALYNALMYHSSPAIFHSDNGREYEAKIFIEILMNLSILVSRSHPGCPWENGYQESFYGKFKLDFGDPNRHETLGELVAEIYRAIWIYNNTRIHSALKMPPTVFASKCLQGKIVDEKVS